MDQDDWAVMSKPRKMDKKLVFSGQLAEEPAPYDHCGDEAIAAIFKFDVIEEIHGELPKQVLVIIPCPALKGEGFFAVGRRYRIEASSEFEDAGMYSFSDRYANEHIPRYWCSRIEPA